jgi:hypothetical protein
MNAMSQFSHFSAALPDFNQHAIFAANYFGEIVVVVADLVCDGCAV